MRHIQSCILAMSLYGFLTIPAFAQETTTQVSTALSPSPQQASQSKKSFASLLQSAQAGNVSAMLDIGIVYESGKDKNGQSVQQDYAQALVWYQKAAAQGDAAAQNKIGFFYQNGWGVQKDYTQAIVWYRKAAAQGYATAERNMGLYYLLGWAVPRDYSQAFAWFKKAAAQGDSLAEGGLGLLYEKGLGVSQDYSQSMAWYQMAADHGDEVAKTKLAALFTSVLQSAEAGNVGAMLNVGTAYELRKDYSQAFVWYQKAAAQGNAEAQYHIGSFYDLGWGVPKDYSQALAWYQKAAAQGNALGQVGLGTLYEYGWGVQKDKRQALAWYQKAAAQGNELAKIDLEALQKLDAAAEFSAEADLHGQQDQDDNRSTAISILQSMPGASDPNAIVNAANQQGAQMVAIGAANDAARRQAAQARLEAQQAAAQQTRLQQQQAAAQASLTAQQSSARPVEPQPQTVQQLSPNCLRVSVKLFYDNQPDSGVYYGVNNCGVAINVDIAMASGYAGATRLPTGSGTFLGASANMGAYKVWYCPTPSWPSDLSNHPENGPTYSAELNGVVCRDPANPGQFNGNAVGTTK